MPSVPMLAFEDQKIMKFAWPTVATSAFVTVAITALTVATLAAAAT
jgi:hypothetical protein